MGLFKSSGRIFKLQRLQLSVLASCLSISSFSVLYVRAKEVVRFFGQTNVMNSSTFRASFRVAADHDTQHVLLHQSYLHSSPQEPAKIFLKRIVFSVATGCFCQ